MICQKCKKEIPADSLFCPFCGSETQKKTVPQNGRSIKKTLLKLFKKKTRPTKKTVIWFSTILGCSIVVCLIAIYCWSYFGSISAAKSMNYETAVNRLWFPQITQIHDSEYVAYVSACERLLAGDYSVRNEFKNMGDYLCASQMEKECLYQHGLSSIEEEKYDVAIADFQQLINITPEYKELVEQYTDALRLEVKKTLAKEDLSHATSTLIHHKSCPNLNAIIEELKPELYNTAVKMYRKGDYSTKSTFEFLKNYKDSEKYLILCESASQYSFYITNAAYNRLLAILDFENAKDIIMKRHGYATYFLTGRWSNNSGEFFQIENNLNHSCTYNLPHNDLANSYYTINGGVYSLSKEDEATTKELFKIAVIDKNTISVYCYKDGSKHTLYRQ